MEVEKLKELREIANRDSAVSLTVRAADLRALLDEVDALTKELSRVRDNLRCHLSLANCDEEFIRVQTHGAMP